MRLFRQLGFIAVICLLACGKPQKSENVSQIAAPTVTPTQTKPAGRKVLGGTNFEQNQIGVQGVLLREISYGLNIISPDDIAIVKEQTIGSGNVESIAPDSMLAPDTIEAFKEANSQSSKLKHSFDVYIGYKVVPSENIPSANSKEFKAKFPKSKCVVGLSRVGFNKEMTQALTMTEIECEQTAKRTDYWLIYNDEEGVTKVKQLSSR
jgi:hypothetical protein